MDLFCAHTQLSIYQDTGKVAWCISKPRHRNSQLGEETMLTSRPLQSPHCVMALKHVNQKAARCYWCQIVVTPLVPKQNTAGGPKVVTLTPLRSSAHRNAANGWCGSSLLLCLTHCIEVHDSYWILWQITEITKPEWTQLVIPSVYVSLNVTKWHQVAQ